MVVMDFVNAFLFSLAVLLTGLAGGCLFSLVTLKANEVESLVEKRIEYGMFATACIVFTGLIIGILS
ncbi:hypothetical protein VV869_03620 [Photobacterium sp. MCCC 1A19761]|uniref:hypothetical protein n=1 Tax=unclassified Photobacterium TaxID=2628852 RepID=UPI0021C1A57C|nr:hypothetical protein [Photobacterium sp. TY1-4]UXI00202.1 hypothetical protein NH461_10250 [Photobacterium sp. TY1-4]